MTSGEQVAILAMASAAPRVDSGRVTSPMMKQGACLFIGADLELAAISPDLSRLGLVRTSDCETGSGHEKVRSTHLLRGSLPIELDSNNTKNCRKYFRVYVA